MFSHFHLLSWTVFSVSVLHIKALLKSLGAQGQHKIAEFRGQSVQKLFMKYLRFSTVVLMLKCSPLEI